jgi:hypothetical protein
LGLINIGLTLRSGSGSWLWLTLGQVGPDGKYPVKRGGGMADQTRPLDRELIIAPEAGVFLIDIGGQKRYFFTKWHVWSRYAVRRGTVFYAMLLPWYPFMARDWAQVNLS